MRFEHELANTTPEKAFPVIQEWLQSEKAKTKESRSPNYIQASHGRMFQPMGWRRDARKTIRFQLAPQGANVLVSVDIIPAALNQSDVNTRINEARANWSDLLAGLWARFGEPSPVGATANYGIDWNASLKTGKRWILIGLIVVVIGFALTLILAVFALILMLAVFVFIPVIGVLLIVNGAMNYRSAKRRLSAQTTN